MAENSSEGADSMVESRRLYLSYLLTGNLDELEQAVRCAREELEQLPLDARHMLLFECMYNLGRPLVRIFLHTRNRKDIAAACELFAFSSIQWTDDNPLLKRCHEYYGISRFLLENELEGSVELNDLHVYTPAQGKITIETRNRNWGDEEEVFHYYLWKLQEYSIALKQGFVNPDSTIPLHRQALNYFSDPFPDPLKISMICLYLGDDLLLRYTRNGLLEDIDEAIDCFGRALKSPMQNHVFAACLYSKSSALIKRFEARGGREDLDNSLNFAEQAVANFDTEDVHFASCLDNLARVRICRFRASGEPNDLDAAIRTSLHAIHAIDVADGPAVEVIRCKELPTLLVNLASNLKLRFARTGHSEDLRHAIKLMQRALDLQLPGDPRRAQVLVLLSICKYMLGGNLSTSTLGEEVPDLEVDYKRQAMRHLDEAWSVHFQTDQSNPRLDFLLFCVTARQLFTLGERDQGIHILQSLEKFPEYTSHPQAGQYRLFLSDSLFKRWVDTPVGTRTRKDLDEAIIITRRVIDFGESKVDESIFARNILGNCLYQRYKLAGEKEDVEKALELLEGGVRMSSGARYFRVLAGQAAIDILSELKMWDRAWKLSQEIVDLIVLLNGRSLVWTDKQNWLHLCSRQTSTYASIALEAERKVFDVIDILETCRGAILSHVIDSRTDLDDLKKVAPGMAERFSTLRDDVNPVIDPSGGMNTSVDEINRREKSEEEIRACLTEIRKLEGFHRFLLGPTESELRAAAAQGPIVVVNVSSIRSDAIIITKDAVVVLRLPAFEYKEVLKYPSPGTVNFTDVLRIGKMNKSYSKFLEKLWSNCVELIFQKLDDLKVETVPGTEPGTAKFHVWWIGVGIASSFPFHAAGIYTDDGGSALSRAISTYTPSLKILIHGRRKLKSSLCEPDVQRLASKPKILIVAMPTTPGIKGKLHGVEEEATAIQNIVKGVYFPQPSLQPNAKDTMECMKNCEVVHFACHGQSVSTDPSSSHLLLQAKDPRKDPDSGEFIVDKLRVRDVAVLNLSHGKLAFLSACSTAENRAVGLHDEVLHLVSAFHVAGYLHTVGNLWTADDEVSVEIVRRFYKHLKEAGELGDGENVAKALHETLIEVIKTEKKKPLYWAQFVHFGVC